MKTGKPQKDMENFSLLILAPDDKSLPKPRYGVNTKKKTPNLEEEAKLKRIIDFGGLVPERSPILDRLCRKVGELTHEQSS
jgi:hypothetical protein